MPCARSATRQTNSTARRTTSRRRSAGAQCVECHMPTQTYMLVDPRRDHSLRIPRPDLSLKLGVPNACNQCHPRQGCEMGEGAFYQVVGQQDLLNNRINVRY